MPSSQKPSVLKFFCSSCEQKLSVPAGSEGKKFSCPSCSTTVRVPRPKSPELGENGEPLIKFFCLHCGQKLSCEMGETSLESDCPVCAKSTPVPPQAVRPEKSSPDESLFQGPLTKRQEEPEIVLGPDTENTPNDQNLVAPESPAFPSEKPKLVGEEDEEPEKATRRVEDPEEASVEDKNDRESASRELLRPRALTRSVNPKELFESLEDFGFEVEQRQTRAGESPGEREE